VGDRLLVILVQPDSRVREALACALEASGHEVLQVSAATWAVPLLREDAPDVVVVERASRGYERLLDALDDLDVYVPVVVTRFALAPPWSRAVDGDVAREVLRSVEVAARR
jgi:DNA-binding NtrC family response regulator